MNRGVLVVGGGLAGASVALELAARDVAVIVVERESVGGRATAASAGMLAAQYEAEEDDAAFRLGLRGREEHGRFVRRLEALSEMELRHRTDGMLVANRTRQEDRQARSSARWQRGAGLRAEVIDPEAATELQPGLGEAVSYLWLPDEAQVDTQRLGQALPAALGRAGVEVITGRRAVEVRSAGGRVRGLRLEGGRELDGQTVVVAAGAWSGTLRGLPRKLPVRPVRGQILRLASAAARPLRLLALHDGRYLVPRQDGTTLAGSTMEPEAGFDATVTGEGERRIRDGVAALYPALADAAASERWAGLRPLARDGRPVLGPDPDLDGLHYATGYGRNGILLSPVGARVVADLVTRGSTDLAWRPLGPGRFRPAPADSPGS